MAMDIITRDKKNIRCVCVCVCPCPRSLFLPLHSLSFSLPFSLSSLPFLTRIRTFRWKGFPQSLEKERQVVMRRHHEVKRELDKKMKEVYEPHTYKHTYCTRLITHSHVHFRRLIRDAFAVGLLGCLWIVDLDAAQRLIVAARVQ
jgi:hypothetical protein